jgi:formamidopyrimidine-DNA glycosylase
MKQDFFPDMPELPEVETIRRGIAPWVLDQPVARVVVRQPQLRWSVPADLAEHLVGRSFFAVQRRAKYLLLQNEKGWLLIHLGMSGSLRIVPSDLKPGRHDHVDIAFENGRCLRLNDPRRFGAVLWAGNNLEEHALLAHLGPEPLSAEFNGTMLYARSRGRKLAVKNFIMDQRVVVGIGNIYASEALFRAGIHPGLAAGLISRRRYGLLADSVRQVLTEAIAAGGTTLRDFTDENGRPGYFSQQLLVYGREGQPCVRCGELIVSETIGQRSSFFCRRCQR